MRKLGMLAMLAALAGCANAPGGPQSAATAGAPEAITLEIRSWGVLRTQWRLTADGTGSYTRAESDGDFYKPDMVTQPLAGTPDDFRAIVAILQPVRRVATAEGGDLPCERVITDMPYGSVTFEQDDHPIRLDFDIGCRSDETPPVHEALAGAQEAVARVANGHPAAGTNP